MGNLIKITGKHFENGNMYYSKAMKLAYTGKKVNTTDAMGIDFYQLYAVNGVITNKTKYSLAGNVAEIFYLFSDNALDEHAFDIVDADNNRRLIITCPNSTTFIMYYINSTTIYKYVFTTSSVSLGNALIQLRINMNNGSALGQATVFLSTNIYQYDITVSNVSDSPDVPASYKTFDNLNYGIRIQGDADGNIIENSPLRFKGIRISVDDVEVTCTQCTPPNLYDWVTESYFSCSGNSFRSTLAGDSTKSTMFKVFEKSNFNI